MPGSSYEIGLLELQRFLIKEQVAPPKTVASYAIFDPDTQEQVGIAHEQPGSLAKLLRVFLNKKLLPTKLEVREMEDESLVFTIRRRLGFWRQRIEIYDAEEYLIGHFESKVYTGQGGFWGYSRRGEMFAEIKGDGTGWSFSFVTPDGRELGVAAKQGAGLDQELFTSANDYLVSIHEELAEEPLAKMLLLGAALALDIVYHVEGG